MKLDNIQTGVLAEHKPDIVEYNVKDLKYDIKWIKEALRMLIIGEHDKDISDKILSMIDIKADIGQYK